MLDLVLLERDLDLGPDHVLWPADYDVDVPLLHLALDLLGLALGRPAQLGGFALGRALELLGLALGGGGVARDRGFGLFGGVSCDIISD